MAGTTPNVEEGMKSNITGHINLKKVIMFDHISQLPDCILSLILTKLSIKEFLKTRLLSKRWCNLWTLRRDLYFDIFNVFEYTEQQLLQKGYLNDVLVHSSFSSKVVRRLNLDTTRDLFVKLVDQFLKHSNATIIDSFLVNFYLNSPQQSTIDEWISFVIPRGVGKIDLLFCGSPYTLRNPARKPYKFPLHLFLETNASTLKHLCLEYCLLYHPTNYDFSSFKNLSFLSLKKVEVDETFIESLLSISKQLEELHLIECEFKSLMPKIVSSSLCHLKVTSSYVLFRNYRDVILSSLDCLKLTSLDYDGNSLGNMNFNTPMLNNIQLHVENAQHLINTFRLLATLPKLENLQLHIISLMVPPSPKISQRLEHLKQLNLILNGSVVYLDEIEFNLLVILTILQASPLLQKLSVMITYPEMIESQKVVTYVEEFSHYEVKVIELRGCVGNSYEIEFAMNVIKSAHKLEQIVLSPYWREDESLDWNSDPAWFQNGRQRISEKFQSEQVVGREKLVLI